MKLKGQVKVTLTDIKSGEILREEIHDNEITEATLKYLL
jgi:hypothetical protein